MRVYNVKVSEKVNESLNRREAIVKKQKSIIGIALIIAISVVLFMSSSIHAFANSVDNSPVNKYYTSIEVQSGDTLWDLADLYIGSYNIDKEEYIEEVCRMNNLTDGQIHAGKHIIISYYTNEVK